MHYKVKLDASILPGPVKKVLGRFKEEKGLVLKGGGARLALLLMLERHGKEINPERVAREKETKDLDIILIHLGTLPKSRDFLLQREQEIREKIRDTKLVLMGRDIEPVRGKVGKDGRISEDTVERILRSRDLTINEVILVPENGQWWMYYTKRCWRDIILSIGMLNAKDPKTTRIDLGRIVPSNRGFYRLFKFWVEEKVEKIWLPEWQRIAHLTEMFRLQGEGKIPDGANIGSYSLIIAERYNDSDITIKRRWLRALTLLNFPDYEDFDYFVEEQRFWHNLKNQDNEFQFESNPSFEQIIDRLISERAQRQEARHRRKELRNQCQHEFATITCEGCSRRCVFQKCQKCTQYVMIGPNVMIESRGQELPCNKIFITGNWRADEKSLRSFPKKSSLKRALPKGFFPTFLRKKQKNTGLRTPN